MKYSTIEVTGDVKLSNGGGGSSSWGSISGNIENQTDLINKFDEYALISSLAEVATSGSYDDLIDKPTIPTNTSDLNNDSGYITSVPVDSVNGKTGTVVLNASDVGALSDTTVIPTKTSDLQNDSGFLTSVPVTSVNNKTGAVNLSASDVGALPDNTTYVSSVNGSSGEVTITVPTKTSDLNNDSGFLTSAVTTFNGQNGAVTYSAPVSSVNSKTGAVVLSASDVGALDDSTVIPTKTSDLVNDSGFITSAPVSSVDGKTGAVTVLPTGGTTGQVLAKASATDRDVEWITPSGGSSEWTLLYDTTLESDQSSNIYLNYSDVGGYSEIHYSISVVGKTGLASAMDLIVTTENNTGNQPRFNIPLATSGYELVYGHLSTNFLQHLQAKASVGAVTHNCTANITPYFTQQGRTGKIVVFWLLYSSTGYLPAGSQIKIWGKK